MAQAYDIVISPVEVSDAEKERWKTRLLNAKSDMIAGIQATDYAEALNKALSEYFNKVASQSNSPSIVKGYAKMVARLPAVDANELKTKLINAIQSAEFDTAVENAVTKWGEVIGMVKGAGLGGKQLGDIVGGYLNPDVAPFVIPGVVASTVYVGFYGLIFAKAVSNGFDQTQAEAMLANMANGTLKPVIEKALSGDATLVAFNVSMTPGDNPTVTIHVEIEAVAGNTGGTI